MSTGGPFAPPGQSNDAMSQGPDPASHLHPATTSAASAAMPLGLEGWSGVQMPVSFAVSHGAASGSKPVAGQSRLEQGSGAQAGAAVEREYTINGKRK